MIKILDQMDIPSPRYKNLRFLGDKTRNKQGGVAASRTKL